MKAEERVWAKEFGAGWNVPPEIDKLVAEGILLDDSWGMDACPSFCVAGAEDVYVLVDRVEPEKRELEAERFLMGNREVEGSERGTEDLAEVIAFVMANKKG